MYKNQQIAAGVNRMTLLSREILMFLRDTIVHTHLQYTTYSVYDVYDVYNVYNMYILMLCLYVRKVQCTGLLVLKKGRRIRKSTSRRIILLSWQKAVSKGLRAVTNQNGCRTGRLDLSFGHLRPDFTVRAKARASASKIKK